MGRPFLVIIAAVAAIMVLTAMSIRSRKERESRRIRRELKESWGKPGRVKRTSEYREALLRYALRGDALNPDEGGSGWTAADDRFAADAAQSAGNAKGKTEGQRDSGAFTVDAITWQDLDLDQLYDHLAVTRSSPGDAVFYDRMRHPSLDEAVLSEYDRLTSFFSGNESARVTVQEILSEIGREGDRTLYDDLKGAENASPIGTAAYRVLALLTLADLVFLFIQPLAAVIVFIGLTAFNIVLALRMKERLGGAVNGFRAALKLMKAGEDICRANLPELSLYCERMAAAKRDLASFKRGSFLVTGRDKLAEGLGEAVLQYVNLLFHLDLMKFDQMLKAFKENESACVSLFEDLGALDTGCAAASMRAMFGVWCRPERVLPAAESKSQEAGTGTACDSEMGAGAEADRVRRACPYLQVRNLAHPLLDDPVPVTVTLDGGLLVTGSNASGKSTFLKEIAIAVLMAQSFMTVPAQSYEAPRLRVMTSMALTDNLTGGESYYIVEIRSIKRILDAIGGGAPLLAVVDEVLKGTNTIERIAASAQVLKAMVQPGTLVIAATHDRELTDMLKTLYVNKHFEESISGKDILFTYELKDGPASTRNAIRLLEAEGYDGAIVGGARQSAERFETTGEWTL